MYTKPLALAITVGVMASQANAAGFLEDSKLSLSMRNNQIATDNRESQDRVGNTAYSGQNREWGQGFALRYSSGYTEGTVGFGLDALGLLGIRLDDGGRAGKAGETRTPGNMFPLESDGSAVSNYSRVAFTGKARVSKTELRVGTVQGNLPVFQTSSGHLFPQTYEGVQFTSKDISNLSLAGGYIEHAVGRSSTNATGMAVTGGTRQSNKFVYGGGDWAITKNLTAQYYYGQLEDYYTQNFAGLKHVWPIDDKQSLVTDLRYFRTDSDGANSTAAGRAKGYIAGGGYSSTGGEIDNRAWSASFTYSYLSHSLMVGHQRLSGGSGFFQLSQGSLPNENAHGASYYLQTDRQLSSFLRADERTSFAQYNYNFASLGYPGLRAGVIYLSADNIRTATGYRQKEWERDISVDYTVQSGALKGINFAVRQANLRTQASNDLDQVRFIVDYKVDIL
ncbi:Outer membrane porin [Pseudomonas amygdali pv. eriobotryae]|uniref:Outer membrane porin n=1 Tax=Pseudomonas amygdali pv. eriobotryae TaxID=129137 RepID=A0A0P9S4U5_PSEA0|nr:OprD family outer membrane porin [Pseudomonas amygdali]KPX20654.1 Outer membrane porin [Pseudomonas amygdali pv. eriobotryae]KWS78394.1 porin [Pseudomonas amygdali pv. eriobotryae]RMM02426.1 Outer membrane porin [Pseudomonas amygdali pv. eriobotryae]RMO66777.1 Outer membrane porin [Pseudomonas amygdali pv. eriobotryae]GFZ62741.1 porin OprE [Pseudomonas amygdali pv. eriobotryae]